MQKHCVFGAFFEYQLMSVKHNDDVTTISKKHKNITAEIIDFSLFLIKILIIFRIDVRTRNFEVLGRILASILGVLGRSWGRLGASWAPLGPHFGAKVPTRRQPHHPTKKTRKPGVPKSEIGGTRAHLWGAGKTANSEKSIAKVSQNTGENANGVNMA